MLQPRTKKIDTTLGEFAIRAMKRKEHNQLIKLMKGLGDNPETADSTAQADASAKMEELYFKCIIDKPKGVNFDDLEVWEVQNLQAEINKLSREAPEKN